MDPLDGPRGFVLYWRLDTVCQKIKYQTLYENLLSKIVNIDRHKILFSKNPDWIKKSRELKTNDIRDIRVVFRNVF